MKASGYVHVDSTDIRCSDHYLVWMELGRTTKTTRKAKRVIRKWRLERFEDREVKLNTLNAQLKLRACTPNADFKIFSVTAI